MKRIKVTKHNHDPLQTLITLSISFMYMTKNLFMSNQGS